MYISRVLPREFISPWYYCKLKIAAATTHSIHVHAGTCTCTCMIVTCTYMHVHVYVYAYCFSLSLDIPYMPIMPHGVYLIYPFSSLRLFLLTRQFLHPQLRLLNEKLELVKVLTNLVVVLNVLSRHQ